MIVSPRVLRQKARGQVMMAVLKGQLPRIKTQTCVDCGAPARRYDHRDYRQPLKVEPVCHYCDSQRGPGEPAIDGNDVEVPWVRPTKKIKWRHGCVLQSKIIHYWDVDEGKSKCGLRSDYVSFGLQGGERFCKRCSCGCHKRKRRKLV